MCTPYRGGSVLLPPVEEVDTTSRQRKKCLLYTEERSPDALCRGERTPSLYREEGASFLHQAQSVPLLYVQEADSFSVQERECFSLDRGESVPLLYVEGRVSLVYTRSRETLLVAKECVSLFQIARMTYSFSLPMRVCSSSPQRG